MIRWDQRDEIRHDGSVNTGFEPVDGIDVDSSVNMFTIRMIDRAMGCEAFALL